MIAASSSWSPASCPAASAHPRLLERRPDIAAAERQMAAANAAISIAYAAYYPDITLSGGVGLAGSTLGSLFSWPARVWSIGATLSETLFDGGLRRATVDQSKAVYDATVAAYRQTVLLAFQQVEDDLAQVRVLAQEIEQQRRTVTYAERALELERVRYLTGIDLYINVMHEQTLLLDARQMLVNFQVQEMIVRGRARRGARRWLAAIRSRGCPRPSAGRQPGSSGTATGSSGTRRSSAASVSTPLTVRRAPLRWRCGRARHAAEIRPDCARPTRDSSGLRSRRFRWSSVPG